MVRKEYLEGYAAHEEIYGKEPNAAEKYKIQQIVDRDRLSKKAGIPTDEYETYYGKKEKHSISKQDEKNLKDFAKKRKTPKKIPAPGGKKQSTTKKQSDNYPEAIDYEESGFWTEEEHYNRDRRTDPGKGRKRLKPIVVDQSKVKSKGIPDDLADKRHVISARRAFFNPKTKRYWVNGLSGDIPKDSKNFIELDGNAKIKATKIESEKHNKHRSNVQAGKKANRTRKINKTKKTIGEKKESVVQWGIKRKEQTKNAGAMTKAGGKWAWGKGKNAGAMTKAGGKWAWGKGKKAGAKGKKVAWTDRVAADRRRKHIAQPTDGISGAVRYGGRKLGSFGYSLPGPFAIWTLAWTKMTKALKALTIIVMAVVLLFVPWGIFYYSGWAVGASFMFLLSLIFWVFVSVFNGIAYVLVALINAITRMIMMGIIGFVEWVTGFFTGNSVRTVSLKIGGVEMTKTVSENYWVQGHELLENSLIPYDMIASVPSLMHIVTPDWKPWFNDSIIGHLLNMAGIKASLTFISDPFRQFYETLDTTSALLFGLGIAAIPIVFLAYVYFKNRHHLY